MRSSLTLQNVIIHLVHPFHFQLSGAAKRHSRRHGNHNNHNNNNNNDNNNNNNNNSGLCLERVKTLNSGPKTLMTLWPSKQLQNIDATTNNYKIYHIKKIKYNK